MTRNSKSNSAASGGTGELRRAWGLAWRRIVEGGRRKAQGRRRECLPLHVADFRRSGQTAHIRYFRVLAVYRFQTPSITATRTDAANANNTPAMSRSINGIALLPFTTALTTVRKNATKVHLRPEIRLFGCRVTGGVCSEFGMELYTSKAPDVRPGPQAAHSRRVTKEGARARRRASDELWGMVVFRSVPPLRTLPRGRYQSPHDVPLALPVDPVWHLHLDLRRLARPGLQEAVRQERICQGVPR